MKEQVFNLLKQEKMTLKNLFSICVGKIYSNNIELYDFIGNYTHFDTDLVGGKLFCDDKEFDVEFLGTTSQEDGMWFSAELEKQIPDQYVKTIIESRNLLNSMKLALFGTSKIKINGALTGEVLAIIYSAFAKDDNTCYFVGSNGPISLYMIVKNFVKDSNVIQNINADISSSKFVSRVMEIMSKYDVNHKLMIKSFLINNHCDYTEDGQTLVGLFNDSKIYFKFDDYGNMESASGSLN